MCVCVWGGGGCSLNPFFVPGVGTKHIAENSSFIFSIFVKSVPLYHFSLLNYYVVLQMAIEAFESHF